MNERISKNFRCFFALTTKVNIFIMFHEIMTDFYQFIFGGHFVPGHRRIYQWIFHLKKEF